jgi:hypothetical protein
MRDAMIGGGRAATLTLASRFAQRLRAHIAPLDLPQKRGGNKIAQHRANSLAPRLAKEFSGIKKPNEAKFL